jgi:mycothiol synthase
MDEELNMEHESGDTRLFMRRPHLYELPQLPTAPPGYSMRTYEADDCRGLGEVLSRSFQELWDDERVRSTLTAAPDVVRTHVVLCEARLVATASVRILPDLYPGSGYLHYVGVDPAHTRRGLGRLVTLRVLHDFRDAGLRDAVLETEVFRLPAIRLYLQLGFVPESRDLGEQIRWSSALPRLLDQPRSGENDQ